MADITLCTNQDCTSRHHCYRFRATPATPPTPQSYAEFAPNAHGHCPDYIQMRRQKGDGDDFTNTPRVVRTGIKKVKTI